MTDKLEVQGFLCATKKVVFLLHTVELALKYVYRVHGGIGTHVALHRARLNPFLQYVIDLVLYDFVFGDNLELKTSCADMMMLEISSLRQEGSIPSCSWIESFFLFKISL